MAWFRVDDKLPSNKKARRVRKSHPTKDRDVAPYGIWVLAGAWSDDGFVPLEVLEDWDDDAEILAERLVVAGTWHRTTRDGERGYIFHDWHDQNPAHGENDPSSTGTFGNHIRWHVQRQIVAPDCTHCPTEPNEPSADIGPDIAPDAMNHRGESLPSRPDPTRPDPDPNNPRPSGRATEPPERFDEFWDTYALKVGRQKAETAYRNALAKPGVTADLLVAAAATYITFQTAEGKHPEFTKHPTTWLRGEHWRDERPARSPRRTNTQDHLALVAELGNPTPNPFQIGGPAS
jgi:hypothetical protein